MLFALLPLLLLPSVDGMLSGSFDVGFEGVEGQCWSFSMLVHVVRRCGCGLRSLLVEHVQASCFVLSECAYGIVWYRIVVRAYNMFYYRM